MRGILDKPQDHPEIVLVNSFRSLERWSLTTTQQRYSKQLVLHILTITGSHTGYARHALSFALVTPDPILRCQQLHGDIEFG